MGMWKRGGNMQVGDWFCPSCKDHQLHATRSAASVTRQSPLRATWPSTRARLETGLAQDARITSLPATRSAASARLPSQRKATQTLSNAGGASRVNAGTMGKSRSPLAPRLLEKL